MKRHFILSLVLSFVLIFVSANVMATNLPTKANLESQLQQLKKSGDASKADVTNLTTALQLLDQISNQKKENEALTKLIANAPKTLAHTRDNINSLKNNNLDINEYSKFNLDQLQSQLNKIQTQLQTVQTDLVVLNSQLVNQRATPEKSQKILSNNLIQYQKLEKSLFNDGISHSEKIKLTLQLALIKLQNDYNQNLLQGDSSLLSLYSVQLEEKNIEQQQLQLKQSTLQELINKKKLEETQQQAEQLKQAQQKDKNVSPLVLKQQSMNLNISQELIKQTTSLNNLTQDNLRITAVLNNLKQTERNINEQISALQGTLVLSRIINKQKQLLPEDTLINGLSKQITSLRIKIFDLTETRDNLYDVNSFIDKLSSNNDKPITDEERAQLIPILQERYRLISNEIELLNNQLNLAINVELNQKQVISISDALQNKLQLQSFWVKSNPTMNTTWFANFIPKFQIEVRNIYRTFNFTGWHFYIIPAAAISIILAFIGFLIEWQRKTINSRLRHINNCVNTLKKDRQRFTPEALAWTVILSLPSTFFLLAILILISTFLFENPVYVWGWATKMSLYWLFFATTLRILSPDPYSIGYRHFGLQKNNLEAFTRFLKSFIIVSYLWINASIFTHLDGGVNNDVIGQFATIIILIFSLFYCSPKIHKALHLYESISSDSEGNLTILFKIIAVISYLAPIGLMVLIVLGYYYTALNLMHHLIISYFVLGSWSILRDVTYRAMLVFSRHLSYRRLLEKQEKLQHEDETGANLPADDESFIQAQMIEDEVLAVSKIKAQVLRVVNIGLFLTLLTLLYWVWSDLVTVAYYLESINLWQHTTMTPTGPVLQAVTLWNLMVALIIILTTYALIRNLPGVLEVLLFTHIKFSQGTPYTITTLSTYFIFAMGAALAFATLGLSWNKLQWLFAALSVGLGFGLQEIFANFVSGLIILFERPVRVGDVITIGNFSGTVSRIRIRSTTLVDFDRKEIIVPNKAFVTERIVNWALSNSITRVKVFIGVAYGSDLELVKKLLLQIADECPYALKDPKPTVYFMTFGASTLDHELRVYVNDIGHRNKSIDYINHRINALFAQHNIDIAFNQLDVYIKNTQNNEEIKVATYDLMQESSQSKSVQMPTK
ncbi:mechanosensitive channel MscK [Actinobacillus delphinicola]|uniref:Potassium efflux protein KefA n=1 Tax=Actinobacillus delphinicola TaxID=51161 RepID=A0A448TRJ7_9PAST|nr:mechanosensitive channel MscK [Actinobacillus delphinicola]VEJ08687.1 potassium efflux protein KefA [Actinobacillus delphinicola]